MHELSTYHSFGLTERKGIARTDSLKISENFGKEHRRILQDIREMECSDEFRLHNFVQSSYKNEQNKKQPEYLMTRDGFSILVMGFTGKKAMKFKEAYIKAFNQMEAYIKDLLEAKVDFPEFTDAILSAHEEPKHYHFSNECDMINRIVTGMSAKQFRELNNIEQGKSIRPYLNSNQIEAVKSLQRIDIGLIYSIPDFQQRKQFLERYYARIGQKFLSA